MPAVPAVAQTKQTSFKDYIIWREFKPEIFWRVGASVGDGNRGREGEGTNKWREVEGRLLERR